MSVLHTCFYLWLIQRIELLTLKNVKENIQKYNRKFSFKELAEFSHYGASWRRL